MTARGDPRRPRRTSSPLTLQPHTTEVHLDRVGIGGAGGGAEEHLGWVGAVVEVPAAVAAAGGGIEDGGTSVEAAPVMERTVMAV